MHRFKFVLYRPAPAHPGAVRHQHRHLRPGPCQSRRSGAPAAWSQGDSRGHRGYPRTIRARSADARPVSAISSTICCMANLAARSSTALRSSPSSPDRIAPTLFLLIYAVILAVLLSLAARVLAATQRGRLADQAVRLFSTMGLGLPAFWLGIVLIMLFSIRLGWFPVSGYGDDFIRPLASSFPAGPHRGPGAWRRC